MITELEQETRNVELEELVEDLLMIDWGQYREVSSFEAPCEPVRTKPRADVLPDTKGPNYFLIGGPYRNYSAS